MKWYSGAYVNVETGSRCCNINFFLYLAIKDCPFSVFFYLVIIISYFLSSFHRAICEQLGEGKKKKANLENIHWICLTRQTWSQRNTWNGHDLLTSIYLVACNELKLCAGTMVTLLVDTQTPSFNRGRKKTERNPHSEVGGWGVVMVQLYVLWQLRYY